MSDSGRRTRTRGPGAESAARRAALDRLNAIRSGGARVAPVAIKIEEPIYETVSEEAYKELVEKRRADGESFIVDDDGGDLGYADDGREEDWTNAVIHSSEDDFSDADGAHEKRPRKKNKPSNSGAVKKPPAPTPLVRERLSTIFTSAVAKKGKGSGPLDSSVLDSVLAEVAPDENDWEERRRRRSRVSAFPPAVQMKSELPITGSMALNTEVDLHENHGIGSDIDANTSPEDGDLNLGVSLEGTKPDSGRIVEKSDHNSEVREEAETDQKGRLNSIAKIDVEKSGYVETTRGAEQKEDEVNASEVRMAIDSRPETDDKLEFELKLDGSLPFYIIDAYEEAFSTNSGTLYLFGKVKTGNTFQSCCVVVKNMQRCVYAVPSNTVFPREAIEDLKRKHAESGGDSSPSFRAALQDMASGLKAEIAEQLCELNVSTFMMAPVKRNYAFERCDIPSGEQYVLKISYPFKDPPLDADLKGKNYLALMGTRTSALELFLIKRRIKGPSWLSVSKFVSCSASERVSWCKFEVMVDCPKDISICSLKNVPPNVPPIIAMAINLKTVIGKYNTHEIVSASLVCCHKTKIDTSMENEKEWKGAVNSFTVVRKIEGGIFPIGYNKALSDWNSRTGYTLVLESSGERALLNRLMTEIHKMDPDVLVGHNISGFDLDVLLHRAQACKVPSSCWSKIGRLKRSVMPKLKGRKSIYGSGASPGIMSCVAGRLLCDTYLCARDLLKAVSYSLTELSKTELKEERKEILPKDIPSMLQNLGELLKLVEYGENDAMLSLKLMFKLSALPLTRQLTNISGNLWGKTLQGARAQRVEYLLLHAFHGKKFMVPDKSGPQSKESRLINKRKANEAVGKDGEDADELENNNEVDVEHNDQAKGKKGPSYTGGLVLEPKTGLYDKCVLLLDFNSLYPSIIQEFNICFTTVERSSDGTAPSLPSTRDAGVLPELLKDLVKSRREVKDRQKKAKGVKWDQLNIQQLALKLTANSIYGCLGYEKSRFFAMPLAELITLQGRTILQSTVNLVQDNLSLEVIYGDTDSIMINTGLDDVNKAYDKARMVIQEVNKRYRCLEIDLDGFYKRLLLLKKKKYAGIKLLYQIDHSRRVRITGEKRESKGVDMVRRDWSLISANVGDFCLDCILETGSSSEEVIEKIHAHLRGVRVQLMEDQEKMKNGEIDLKKYEITKTLTKPPNEYPDAKSQPHVQVALRLEKNGDTRFSVGQTVPYIICIEQDASSGPSTGIAQRARHRDELKGNRGNCLIDIDYYLSHQIHTVVSRLCASIQGTSPARLAECLGLDSSKYQSRICETASQDPSSVLLSITDEEERYRACEPLRLSCPSCSATFDCPPVSSILTSSTGTEAVSTENDTNYNFWHRMRCSRCPADAEGCLISPSMLANQVKRQADNFISLYYKGLMMCDVETCKYTTRSVNLRLVGDAEKGTVCPRYPSCDGHLIRQYTEADLYKQLSYFCFVLDASRFLDKLDHKTRAPFERQFCISPSSCSFSIGGDREVARSVRLCMRPSRHGNFYIDIYHLLQVQ
ncbi:DNA polymerase [Rhynchospora pubera]|uniref:DNA polymerase n=1 Tax=Rhynchospora pubera TaxID=906938 RepID=A0AAV8HY62_9POAL|nr:DNA polymerase [Rhynchospora pubera]